MKIIAQLQEKLAPQTYGDEGNQVTKQTCIFVETFPEVEYPNSIAIDFSGENLIIVDALEIGKEYEVNYSVKAKKSEDGSRAFNSLRGWKVKLIGEPQKAEGDDMPL